MKKIRTGLWISLVIGLALVVAPLAMGMFGKANAGQRVMKDFAPIMQKSSVATTATYYGLFQGIGKDFGPVMSDRNVATFQRYGASLDGMSADMQQFMGQIGQQMGMDPLQVNEYILNTYPNLFIALSSMPAMRQDLGAMVSVMAKDVKGFAQVDPALRHFDGLVTVMKANVSNFAKANSLPPMGLFPWFLLIPGAIVALASVWMLFAIRTATATTVVPAAAPIAAEKAA